MIVMNSINISSEEAKKISVDDLFKKLSTDAKGLNSSDIDKRRSEYGFNEIPEKKVHPVLKFLGYFWGPIPWMIEIAAFLSAVINHWCGYVIFAVNRFILNYYSTSKACTEKHQRY